MTAHAPSDPPLGALRRADETRFALFTTTARECLVRLFDDALRPVASHRMSPRGDGRFEAHVAGAPDGVTYKFVLDGRELPDPYARWLPHGVHGPAQVLAATHRWRHGKGPRRPLREQVIYELHVGTFTPEGTYAAARRRLGHLVDLGVTTLELMPLAAFSGARGWGYDGVALFAPHAPYGSPDELRALVDAAHGLGLGVILDVVLNHFGPSGNYLPLYAPEYFSATVHNPWGDAPDFTFGPMRDLVVACARHWLTEFRFDGLRIDAVQAMVDPSPTHIVAELVAAARAIDPELTLIGEDSRNDASLVTSVGLDALWSDDFHHCLHTTLTGERDGYYGDYTPGVASVAQAIDRGWIHDHQAPPREGRPRGTDASTLPASAFVNFIQNHDQVGNRALGERVTHHISVDAWCMASALLLVLPTTPMLFMGQEWAASTPFLYFTDHDRELGRRVAAGRREDFKRFHGFSLADRRARVPHPQALRTFSRSRLRWREREALPHARVLKLYRALLALRRSDEVLARATRADVVADASPPVLRVMLQRGAETRTLLANFSDAAVDIGPIAHDADALVLSTSAEGADRVIAPWCAHLYARSTR